MAMNQRCFDRKPAASLLFPGPCGMASEQRFWKMFLLGQSLSQAVALICGEQGGVYLSAGVSLAGQPSSKQEAGWHFYQMKQPWQVLQQP